MRSALKLSIFLLIVAGVQIGHSEETRLAEVLEEYYELVNDDLPPIGETEEVFLGDQMLRQRYGMMLECVVPQKTLKLEFRKFKLLHNIEKIQIWHVPYHTQTHLRHT